jgi:hypothetical protein
MATPLPERPLQARAQDTATYPGCVFEIPKAFPPDDHTSHSDKRFSQLFSFFTVAL